MKSCSKRAFSLVEMLMALLVASLLMVALAPVITKKFSENLNISSIGGTRADYKRTWYYDPAKEYHEWTVPNGVNVIKVTAIGGGGAGGGASFGKIDVTSSGTWKVPKNIKKIKVYMIGGGGGGASGDWGTGTLYGDTPAAGVGTLFTDFTTEGEVPHYPFTNAKAPALPDKCARGSVSKWTHIGNNELTVAPNGYIPATNGESLTFAATACGGGGGGGGSNNSTNTRVRGGGGGSGGYIINKQFTTTQIPLYIKIGGGGGPGAQGGINTNMDGGYAAGGGGGAATTQPYGGTGGLGDTYGGKGGDGLHSTAVGNAGSGSPGSGVAMAAGGAGTYTSHGTSFYAGSGGTGTAWGGGGGGGGRYSEATAGNNGTGGGGGGGPTIISPYTGSNGTRTVMLLCAGGGGGGGGGINPSFRGAGGGGGGGGYGGGGGGGGGSDTSADRGGAGGAGVSDPYNDFPGKPAIGGGTGNRGGNGGIYYGGYGGGGAGGQNGKANNGAYNAGGIIASVPWVTGTNNSYCNGGNGGSNSNTGTHGKPGALRLFYAGTAGKTKTLQCSFSNVLVAGGGGGGAGQVWVGEIDVTPESTITFTIGKGGAAQDKAGTDGNPGTATSITVGGNTYSVSGGRGGEYELDSTYIANSGGAGGGLKTTNFSSSARYNNWLGVTLSTGGQNGARGYLSSETQNAAGGNGGAVYSKDGTYFEGGTGNGSGGNGSNATANRYGTGGGGGGGNKATSTFGEGGKGANGYIYVEWGNANGGGGASGQVITQESIWVTPGTIVKIYPGKGGVSKDLTVIKDTNDVELGRKGEDGPDGGDTYLVVKDGTADKTVGTAKGGKGGLAGGTAHGRGGGIKVDGSGNYDPNNIQPEIPNSAPGETGSDENGGMGGTMTEEMCPLLTELKKVGLGGCGGNTTTVGACQAAIGGSGEGVNAGGIGNGGGGGAVANSAGVKTPFKGGNGSGGMVTIEWSN